MRDWSHSFAFLAARVGRILVLAPGLGLCVILATSALAFSIVKDIGAAHLLYPGISSLPARAYGSEQPEVTNGPSESPLKKGPLAGLLNPKVAVYFLAFLPQFVDPARGHLPLQFYLLGLTMALLER